MATEYQRNVFINCPFDDDYLPLFEAIVFAVQDSGFNPPRFNMPFELGLDLGCRWFAPRRQDKSLLIFDSENYRYQKYLSDIAGHDIHQHDDNPLLAVVRVRHWLTASSGKSLRAGRTIYDRYLRFRGDLPNACTGLSLDLFDLSFTDFCYAIAVWIRQHPNDA